MSASARSQTDGARRGAALLKAAGPADLARRGRHGARRRALADRPALPLGAPRAAAPRRRRRAAGGVRAMRRARASRSCSLLACRCWRCPALAVQPDEVLPGPGARSSARARSRRAALPRLPEPVDRRFRRAARPRSAPARARAAQRRRQRQRGARLRRRALRRFRAAAAALQLPARCCSGSAPFADPAGRRSAVVWRRPPPTARRRARRRSQRTKSERWIERLLRRDAP